MSRLMLGGSFVSICLQASIISSSTNLHLSPRGTKNPFRSWLQQAVDTTNVQGYTLLCYYRVLQKEQFRKAIQLLLVMVLNLVRTMVSDVLHIVNPCSLWRNAAAGIQMLGNPSGLNLAGAGLAEVDGYQREEIFGPIWFAVPKKRVRRDEGTGKLHLLVKSKIL